MSGLERIRVEAEQPSATLVLVHGAWHGAWCWQDGFTRRLAEHGISTVALSLRGHGGSPGGARLNRLSISDYVDDLAEVTASLDTVPFVAGHSMGGRVVQGLLARLDRPAVAGAALLASLPPRGVAKAVLRKAIRKPGLFARANLTGDLGRFLATEEQVRDFCFTPATPEPVVAATARRVGSESYRAFLDLLVLDRPRPRRLEVPVLVVGAGADSTVTAQQVAVTATAWGTEPVWIDDIGHNLMLDLGWERTADCLAAWVKQHTPGP